MARKKNGGFSWGTFFVGVGTAWGVGAAFSLALWKFGGWAFRPTGPIVTGELPTPSPDDPLEGQGAPGTPTVGTSMATVDRPEGSVLTTRSKPGWGDFQVLLRPVEVEGPGETQVAWEWLVWEPDTSPITEGNTAGTGQRVGPNSFDAARADANAYVDMWGGSTVGNLADE